MDAWEAFLNGVIQALGMWLVLTVMGILSWFALRRWIIKTIGGIWEDIKNGRIEVDGKLRTRRKNNKY